MSTYYVSTFIEKKLITTIKVSWNKLLINWLKNTILTKKSLNNFSIVEKETSEGTDYWIIHNWPWKTSRNKDLSEKGLAEKVNSVKHTADLSHINMCN